MKVVIAGCVKNCGRYLDKTLGFIDSLRAYSGFTETKVIFAYDKSNDNSWEKLVQYKERNPADVDLLVCGNNHKHRAVNIAGARNCVMTRISLEYADYDLLCFLDMDDIVNGALKTETLDAVFKLEWDALSFNRDVYYDIWALRYDPYLCSCWGFGGSYDVMYKMQSDITERLKGDDLLPVKSAFNGLAFFRLNKFGTSRFTGLYEADSDFKNPFDIAYSPGEEDCEWVSFHHDARSKYLDLKVFISPLRLY
jgi:hypothetical protein